MECSADKEDTDPPDLPSAVIHLVKGRAFGGLGVSVINTAATERARGIDSRVVVVTQTQADRYEAHAASRNVPLRCTGQLGMAASILRERLRFRRRVIFNVHSGRSSIPDYVGTLRRAVGGSAAIVATLHGPSDVFPVTDDGERAAQVQLASIVDAVVVPSEFEREEQLRRGLAAERVRAVPDISDIRRGDRAAFRDRRGLDRDALVIGFCGRLANEKGIIETVEACRGIQERWPGIILAVAGVGPQGESAQELAERLGVNARFLGQVDQMANFYAGVDLVAVPSRGESFGYIAVEAALCGTPLVASAIRPWTDWLRRGVDCEMIDDVSGPSIAAAVLRSLEDPDRRSAMARSAQELSERMFSPEGSFARLSAVYADALGHCLGVGPAA